MGVPAFAWGLVKEAARHVLRRPVVGLVAVARTRDGRFVLVRRGDTGEWALPGGTLEWGETLRASLAREIAEECGAELLTAGALVGVYARPDRDPRFHAVTVVVHATVSDPSRPPMNGLEITEVKCFAERDLPERLAHTTGDMLRDALGGAPPTWE